MRRYDDTTDWDERATAAETCRFGQEHKEGPLARAIEEQTEKYPQTFFSGQPWVQWGFRQFTADR